MMRTIPIAVLALVLLALPAGAQEPAPDQARDDAAETEAANNADNGEPADRSRSASPQDFRPSERIGADEAVAFPADI